MDRAGADEPVDRAGCRHGSLRPRDPVATGGAGRASGLILDQSKLNDRHQVLMLAVRYGERALPLLWRVAATEGAIGFAVQKALREAAAPLLPETAEVCLAEVCLMADRFYGTADPDRLVPGPDLGLPPAPQGQPGRR